ncbi:MAG TPA: hypothetical protein VNN09_04955, partial [Candidatus Competibacteraceae bacterium]|nr:hypothetical protein [Candidatus Competibacteraceae bacterium]
MDMAQECGDADRAVNRSATMMSEALRRIRELVGPSGWLDEPAAMAPFLQESRGLFRHSAPAVVSPADTAQVAAVLAICH